MRQLCILMIAALIGGCAIKPLSPTDNAWLQHTCTTPPQNLPCPEAWGERNAFDPTLCTLHNSEEVHAMERARYGYYSLQCRDYRNTERLKGQ